MTKMGKTIFWIIILVLLVLVGWFLLSSSSAPVQVTNPVATTSSTDTGLNNTPDQTNTGLPAVAPVVTTATDAKLGTYLVASNGMTLYHYAKDTLNVSNCTGNCIANWPAYIPTAGEPLVAGADITGQLSTITRADDGTNQLTYKGVPLYFFKNDKNVGDTTGQNFGGIWFVVKP